MDLKFRLFVFAIFICLVGGDNLVSRKCIERPILEKFDVSKYAGKWYEIYRYEQDFSVGCECTYVNYTPNGDKVKVKNCCQRPTGPYCVEGTAVVSYPNHEPLEGRLNVTFFGPPQPSNYWILDSDYEHFAIVYQCTNIDDNEPKESFWLLSRSKVLSPDVKEKAEGLVDKYFDRKSSVFITVKHLETCKYD